MNPLTDLQIQDLLSRYLADELSAQETEIVREHLLANPAKALWIEGVKVSQPVPGLHQEPSVTDIKARIATRLGTSFPGETRAKVDVSKLTPKWAAYALLACCMVIASWWILSSNTPSTRSATYTTYTTRAGQRASITLRDGSQVTLGPATTLRVNATTVASDGVSVEVAGEALFHVNHTAKRPFTVTAHRVTTRVLGTEFVVRAYDASHIRVAVRDGRVSVQSPLFTSNNAAIVTAGEAATVTSDAVPSVTQIVDLSTDFAWAKGDLVLRDVPLAEAFARLSRWYGVEFRVADPSLLSKRVDATFPEGFAKSEINILATVIGARVVYSSNAVTFSEDK